MFGTLAMIRTKLGLTNKEIMKSCWISLQLQMADFPYYDYKAEAGKEKGKGKKGWLSKYKNRYNK